jgi:hypothetical protein
VDKLIPPTVHQETKWLEQNVVLKQEEEETEFLS